jgi:hypothetical protein
VVNIGRMTKGVMPRYMLVEKNFFQVTAGRPFRDHPQRRKVFIQSSFCVRWGKGCDGFDGELVLILALWIRCASSMLY